MLSLKGSEVSVEEKTHHTIGNYTFRLPTSIKLFYDWPGNYYFDYLSIWLLGYILEFRCLYIPQKHYFILSTLWLWNTNEYVFFYLDRNSIFKTSTFRLLPTLSQNISITRVTTLCNWNNVYTRPKKKTTPLNYLSQRLKDHANKIKLLCLKMFEPIHTSVRFVLTTCPQWPVAKLQDYQISQQTDRVYLLCYVLKIHAPCNIVNTQLV